MLNMGSNRLSKEEFRKIVVDGILGVAVGDALGVPYEFCSHEDMENHPCTDMIDCCGYNIYKESAGTWSDDTSLTLCTLEALSSGKYDLNYISELFIDWLYNNKWTASGKVFDVGITTSIAINKLLMGYSPFKSGRNEHDSNGNGSLMRILPVAFYVLNKDLTEQVKITTEVSSITHAHQLSVMSCNYFVQLIINIIKSDKNIKEAIQKTNKVFMDIYQNDPKYSEYIIAFSKLLNIDNNGFPLVKNLDDSYFRNNGFVVTTLMLAVNSVLNNNNYKDAVLYSINKGYDTDTNGAVTGGLAGVLFGNIPKKWVDKIKRKDDIISLCNTFVENNYH